MDIEQICEQIVEDITRRASIAEILLKTQVLASIVDVDVFRQWVNNEQNGYPNPLEVPDYRKLGCNVTAALTIPFHVGMTEMNVPLDAIEHKEARKMLSTVYFDQAAVEAERLAAAPDEGRLRKPTPAMGHQFVQKLFPNAHVEAVYQELTPASFTALIETVKSKILGFVLNLDKEGVIQLHLRKTNDSEVANKIYYQTFNNSVVGNDGGTISAESIILINQDLLSEKEAQKIQALFSQLKVLIKGENDPLLHESAKALNKELQSEKPRRSVIKKGLAIIKGLAMGVASNEITAVINSALGIL